MPCTECIKKRTDVDTVAQGTHSSSALPMAKNEIGQEGNLCIVEPEEQDRGFDVVGVKYINLDSIKFVIFTKLDSSMGQRQTCINIQS